MKTRVLILILLYNLSCFAQQTILIDTSIYHNYNFKPLKDCQKFLNYRPDDSLCAELIRSYQFDEKRNISKVLNSHKGRDVATNLAELRYDKQNKQLARINYHRLNKDTLIDDSKILYFYKNGLLIKEVCIDIVVAKQTYDTMFTIDYTYNSKGLLETENTRNVKPWLSTTGLKKYFYDDLGRIKEIEFIANCCRLENYLYEDNYHVYYTYSGDSSYKETQVFNFENKENNQYGEWIYSKDKIGRIIKIMESHVYPVEVLFVNGEYFPDPNSKTASFENKTIIYTYWKFRPNRPHLTA